MKKTAKTKALIFVLTLCLLVLTFCLQTSVTVNAYDTAAPILTVTNIDSTSNRLKWTKVDGAKYYIIYILNKDTNKYEKYSNEIKGTSCKDTQLLPNTKYSYKVQPIFPDGSRGKMSDSRSVYTRNKYGNSFYNVLLGNGKSGGGISNIYAAVQGEWIYFSVCPSDGPFDDYSEYGYLYKMKTDGTNLQLIKNKCFASYINAAGNKLYYIDINKDHGISYTIRSCDLDGKNTEIIVRDNELDGYSQWDTCHLQDLEIIDDQMLFNANALEGWYSGSNIFALDLTNRDKPIDFAGFGDDVLDNYDDNWTEEDEQRYNEEIAEKRAQYTMSEGLFTDIILRASYQSSHLKDVPAVEKCLEPQKQWLFEYKENLYLCNEKESKLINSHFPYSSGSALMYEDTIYYTHREDINCLLRYKDGKSTELDSGENTVYKIFYADSSRVFFMKEIFGKSDENVSLGIYSINDNGSDLRLLWHCEYPKYKR